jgi:hypothetical protein
MNHNVLVSDDRQIPGNIYKHKVGSNMDNSGNEVYMSHNIYTTRKSNNSIGASVHISAQTNSTFSRRPTDADYTNRS